MAGLVVHMVANAHLDPARLWTWPAGAPAELRLTLRGSLILTGPAPAGEAPGA